MSAVLESRVHVRQASANGPSRGLSLPLAAVTLDPAPGLQGNGLRAATDEDALLRLARGARSEWLETLRQAEQERRRP